VSGTQQGIGAFVSDLSHLGSTSGSGPSLSLPSLTGLLSGGGSPGGLPTLPPPPSISSIISGIQSANTNFFGTLTTNISTAYGTLLPTADIGTALAISLPSYDVNLFLNGINQAISGDPMGLVNAFGDPLAADVGIGTVAGGFEFITLSFTLSTILTGTPHPGVN
jgi:hypothetical protein